MADAVEASGQHVEKEAADEFAGRERHRLDPGLARGLAAGAIVLAAEGDAVVVERDEPGIRDRDAVGVAGQVGEHGLRPGERPLGVDHPLGVAQRREDGVEGGLLAEGREVAEEDEASGRMQVSEPFEEEAAEQAREHPHRQEEARFAGDPARPVRRQAAAGNDDVDVGVVGQRRAPGVQHGGEADARAQMLRVGGDRGQRLGGGPEQEVVDGGLVLERDRADRRRQGEDDVVVGNRQQLRLAVFEPLPRRGRLALRAMAIAAGNGRRPLPALWALPVMGSWRQLDRALASAAANLAPHYKGRLRSAISLSDGWNAPRRRCGGTIDSIASSFSVGSPRV